MKVIDITIKYGISYEAFIRFLKDNNLPFEHGFFDDKVPDERAEEYVRMFKAQVQQSAPVPNIPANTNNQYVPNKPAYYESPAAVQIKDRSNSVAKVLRGIGIADIVLGFIASIIVGLVVADSVEGGIGFLAFLCWFGVSIVSGMIFIGFAEIISLLQQSVNIQSVFVRKECVNPPKAPVNPAPQQAPPKDEKTAEDILEINEKISEESLENGERIKCPYCGNVQSAFIKRCLSCSNLIGEEEE